MYQSTLSIFKSNFCIDGVKLDVQLHVIHIQDHNVLLEVLISQLLLI